jgi:hypothetical protein
VSRIHATQTHLGRIPGIGEALMEYVPGESNSPLFGGNSNWRGPIWLPTNYSLVHALEKYHRFLGPGFQVPVACKDGQRLNLAEIATLIAERLVDLYRPPNGSPPPALVREGHLHEDVHWRDLLSFHEYFHGETGEGLGASHQTGWTGLLANLVMRRYQKDIMTWSGLDRGPEAAPIDEIA